MPFKELLPVAILTFCTFLLPVLISCLIYLLLICKKRKFFETKISNLNVEKPLHAGTPNFNQSQCSKSMNEYVSNGELNSSFDQIHVENQKTDFKNKEFKENGRENLPNTSSTPLTDNDLILKGQISIIVLPNEDDIIEDENMSPALERNKDSTYNSLNFHNVSNSQSLDTGKVSPADFEFNQLEEEKTRYYTTFNCAQHFSFLKDMNLFYLILLLC